jgi:hypothetical protein
MKLLISTIYNKIMDNRVLPFISRYQSGLDQLLSCSKQFTLGRLYDLRCKNRFYFRDGRIKIMNCTPGWNLKCKESWYKEGKLHRGDRDPETGLTLPAEIWEDGVQFWYKEGKRHRDDRDPKTGLTLPAMIVPNKKQWWYKEGKLHRDDRDPETGLTLPAKILVDVSHEWYKEGKLHRDDRDKVSGLTLPAIIWENGKQMWYKKGYRIEPPSMAD